MLRPTLAAAIVSVLSALWAGGPALAQMIEFGPPKEPQKRTRPAPVQRPATAAKPVQPATQQAATQPSAPAPAAPAATPPAAPTLPSNALPQATAPKPPPAAAATTAAIPAVAPAVVHSGHGGAGHVVPPPPAPANCRNSGDFDGWLAAFKKEAAAFGISQATIVRALGGMTLDQGIINRDRGGQKVFSLSYVDFAAKLANPGRLKNAIFMLNKHKALFDRAEAEYGVPGPVIAAFWALESDFGAGMGNLPILRSLATLAYDCRRGPMFREELKAALQLIDRGDMTPEEMVGSWAGEVGQTQFLPSHVVRYAIDYDGDGKRDLFRDIPDIIGTSAYFVKELGWKRGEPWLMEVRVSDTVPWHEAELAIRHPVEQWAKWGVALASGESFGAGLPPASLMLPMGRYGPAFLAFPNFEVYIKWNQSLVYTLTAAYLATRIDGAPAMSKGRGDVNVLEVSAIKELQTLLNKRGYLNSEVDGKLGAGTRKAIKAAQVKYGLPADSYPTTDLISALRGG